MSFSLTRLTLYGIISNIDADLRALVKEQAVAGRNPCEVLSEDLYNRAKIRAENDGSFGEDEYLDYLDFGDSIGILNRERTSISPPFAAFLKRHTQDLMNVVPVRNRVMHARPLQFSDVTAMDDISRHVLNSPAMLFPRTREFIEHVRRDPYFPFSLDVTELHRQRDKRQHNLPLPDFDETGFLGRTEETKQLLSACKGPWPLITVVGEGGYGKTALVLQAAYELLDDAQNPFECIVWSTSKTTRLSLNEIETIEGAITTSLGLFEDISSTLGGQVDVDIVFSEVISYLNEFKILLIIDNLETVLDKRMLDFFSKLNGKSKILVTSRVGTGEMNYRFPLGPLSEGDAIQLLRATARARRVTDLVKAKNDKIRTYCSRMKWNPGFIKWFVSTVQCGKRPEDALTNPKIFLDFCLSNVYGYVGDDARCIARAMLAVPGKHAQPVLSYLTGLEADTFQIALQQLWSTNLVSMSNVPTETGYETIYELNELPRLYILRNHAPSAEEVAHFRGKRKEISVIHEKLQADQNTNRYDNRYIARRTPDDTVLAKYLADAMTASSHKDFDHAFELVEKAKKLDPSFFEVHRVEAMIHRWSGNYAAAMEAYEVAVACEPKSAPLRYWYGGFLLRDAQDLSAALDQYATATALDAGSVQVLLELGRAYMFAGEFDKADAAVGPVLNVPDAPMKFRRKAFDVWLQIPLRRGQQFCERGDFEKALHAFEEQIRRFHGISGDLADARIVATMRKSLAPISVLNNQLVQVNLVNRSLQCETGIASIQISPLAGTIDPQKYAPKSHPNETDVGVEFTGRVHQFDQARKFGFIEYGDGKSIFFHTSDVEVGHVVSGLGVAVDFLVTKDGDKFRATRIASRHFTENNGDSLVVRNGVIKTTALEKGFGFIFDDEGAELFFHATNLTADVKMHMLMPGMRVSYVLGANKKGIVADKINIK